MKYFLLILFSILTHFCFGQKRPNVIFFYKPYTDSIETNLYTDSTLQFDYKIQYIHLKNADINSDVDWAIKNNDLRFISISGYSYLFPGLDGGYKKLPDGSKVFVHLDVKYEEHFKNYGFKVIKGTSDFIDGNELPLQNVSYDYASRYNKRLFAVLGKPKS